MAQGAVKKKAPVAPKKAKSGPAVYGTRVIKPKKAALIKQQQMKKKQSSGLAAQVERSLAEKAGHLEMLRGGKNDKSKDKAAQKAKSGK